MKEPSEETSWWATLGLYGGLGFQIALSLFLGMWLGAKGDSLWGTSPWLSLLGMFIGMLTVIILFKRLKSNDS
jgi:hypothetical protein